MSITNLNEIEIYKQIVDNSRNPLECIREFISNAWDAKATMVDIEISYLEYRKIGIKCKNNGPGLDIEEIKKYILGAGNSTKTFKDDYIGHKGIGTLLYLKCDNLYIESRKGNNLYRVTWENPYLYLQNPDNVEESITTEVYPGDNIENNSYIEIYMEGYANCTDITQYHHRRVKDYIKRYTKVGSIGPLFKDIDIKFDVRVKGLVFDEELVSSDDNYVKKLEYLNKIDLTDEVYTQKEWDSIKFGFDLPIETTTDEIIGICLNDKKFIKQLEQLEDEKKRYQKINSKIRDWLVVRLTNEHPELKEYSKIEYKDANNGVLKESNLSFIISKIGQKPREQFDDMLKTQNNKAFFTQNLKERYGVFLCKDEFPICKIDNADLPRLGDSSTGSTQYLALFNTNDISLIMDRTAPTMDDILIEKVKSNIYYAMKKADSLVVGIVDSINKEIDKLLKINKEDIDKYIYNGTKDKIGNNNNNDSNGTKDKAGNNNNNTSYVTKDKNSKKIQNTNYNGINKGKNLIDMYEEIESLTNKRERINRFRNRKNIKLDNGIYIYEPTSEAELQVELIKVTTWIPNIFDFEILDYNSTKGIDILARDKEKKTYKEEDYYYIELKETLKPDMNHDMRDIRYIICWQISNELRKTCRIKDKLGEEYKIIRHDKEYIAQNNNHKVKIIELKDTIQTHFNKNFE